MPPDAVLAPGDACAEEGRRLFYDRVGRYFYDQPATPFPKPLPCSVCGALLDRGFKKDALVQCQAQRSIVSKRAAAVQHNAKKARVKSDGTPAAERGYVCFSDDRRGVLITPSRSMVVVNVKPVRDIPPDMELHADGSDPVLGKLYEALLDPDLELPALFVMFERAADGPFVLTRSRAAPVRSGPRTPQVIEPSRVASILAIAEAIGPDGLEELAKVKARLVQGNAKPADQDLYLDLCARLPREALPNLPTPGEPAMRMVDVMAKSRKAGKASPSRPTKE